MFLLSLKVRERLGEGYERKYNKSMRTIKVKVSAGAKTEKIEELGPDSFKIRVSAPPEKGKANQRAAEILAEHLGIPKSRVFLQSGATSRDKIFLVD